MVGAIPVLCLLRCDFIITSGLYGCLGKVQEKAVVWGQGVLTKKRSVGNCLCKILLQAVGQGGGFLLLRAMCMDASQIMAQRLTSFVYFHIVSFLGTPFAWLSIYLYIYVNQRNSLWSIFATESRK